MHLRMSVLYFRAFMQAVTITTDLLSNFVWFMPFPQKKFTPLNENENDDEAISISWQNALRGWITQMRKDSCDDSLPFNPLSLAY